MEMVLSITLKANIADEGANINEICRAVKAAMQQASPQVARHIIERMQEDILERLSTSSGRKRKKGLGGHPAKWDEARRCAGRRFTRQGYRPDDRKVKTDIGMVPFRVGNLQCRRCGKIIAPIIDVLEVGGGRRHSLSLEQVAMQVVSETSYRRGEEEIEGRGCAPTPRSSAHRWAISREIPVAPRGPVETMMADGTGFKKWPGGRGDVRIVLGFNEKGEMQQLGTYAGKSWEEIGKEVKEKLTNSGSQLKLFTGDGEPGLEQYLGSSAERSQRCSWHLPRDLSYTMWKDGVDLDERREQQKSLCGLLAVEVPEEQWENVSREDKELFKKEIEKKEQSIARMAAEFRDRGYYKAATYLENAAGRIFSHLHLWLETGVIAPRTVSILESIMREVGRRIKKIAWNWSDRGAARITRMVLMRHYDAEAWDALWEKLLGLKNRCSIRILEVNSTVLSTA